MTEATCPDCGSADVRPNGTFEGPALGFCDACGYEAWPSEFY